MNPTDQQPTTDRWPDCDAKRAIAFLEHRLSDSETLQFEQHLEDCQTCQSWLHTHTVPAAVWEEVGGYLKDDDTDLEILS